jgi:hypothetical protein
MSEKKGSNRPTDEAETSKAQTQTPDNKPENDAMDIRTQKDIIDSLILRMVDKGHSNIVIRQKILRDFNLKISARGIGDRIADIKKREAKKARKNSRGSKK